MLKRSRCTREEQSFSREEEYVEISIFYSLFTERKKMLYSSLINVQIELV